MTERTRSMHLEGDQLFYLSTGQSNLYNFPDVWFPCKGVNQETGKVEKYEWTTQPWMLQLYQDATAKRRLDGVVKEFLNKFNSPTGIENMRTSCQLSSWKICVPYVISDEPEHQLDANELETFTKDVAALEKYLTHHHQEPHPTCV